MKMKPKKIEYQHLFMDDGNEILAGLNIMYAVMIHPLSEITVGLVTTDIIKETKQSPAKFYMALNKAFNYIDEMNKIADDGFELKTATIIKKNKDD